MRILRGAYKPYKPYKVVTTYGTQIKGMRLDGKHKTRNSTLGRHHHEQQQKHDQCEGHHGEEEEERETGRCDGEASPLVSLQHGGDGSTEGGCQVGSAEVRREPDAGAGRGWEHDDDGDSNTEADADTDNEDGVDADQDGVAAAEGGQASWSHLLLFSLC